MSLSRWFLVVASIGLSVGAKGVVAKGQSGGAPLRYPDPDLLETTPSASHLLTVLGKAGLLLAHQDMVFSFLLRIMVAERTGD